VNPDYAPKISNFVIDNSKTTNMEESIPIEDLIRNPKPYNWNGKEITRSDFDI